MTLVDRYTFGDGEHVALRMLPCIAGGRREQEQEASDKHFADQDAELDLRHALLRALHPTGYRDLRAFSTTATVVTHSAPADDLAAVDAFAERYYDRNVFAGVAPRVDAEHRDSAACRWLYALFVDIDFKYSSEAEARRRLAAFPQPPSALVASGGGLQGYWFLTEPLDVAQAKPLLRALATMLGGDLNAAEPARILRVPGTRNYKYDPPRDVIVETFSDRRRYSVDALAAALPLAPDATDGRTFGPLPAGLAEGSRNEALFKEGCRLRRLGFQEPEILATLIAVNGRRCTPPLDTREVGRIAHSCARYEPGGGTADPLAAAIERLNARFAIVSVGNKVVVMDNLPDGSIHKLWPFEEFKKLLSKERVTIKGTTKTGKPTEEDVPLASLWIKHPAGRRYESLVYDMPGSAERCGPDDYNGYLGFTVAPKAGDWSKNRDHALKIICGGDAALYAWAFNWCAALVQWPGRHAFAALVLRGKQGVGKGHFAHLMLGALFHKQQYLHIIGAGMLTGQFNEHLSGKVLVFADESTWGGDPKAANKLKGLVTESTVPIERKFLPLVEEPSCLHTIIASNDEWPVSIPKDDRRFTVFDVAEDKRQNDAHFTPLRAELADGGLAAMLYDLLAHRIDESALRHPPTTTGKQEVMLQSLKPIERWWFEKLTTGVLYGDTWKEQADKTILHDNYLEFLDKHHDTRTRRSTETELGMFLSKHAKALSGRGFWILKPLEDCRRLWAEDCGWNAKHRWPEDEADARMAERDEPPF